MNQCYESIEAPNDPLDPNQPYGKDDDRSWIQCPKYAVAIIIHHNEDDTGGDDGEPNTVHEYVCHQHLNEVIDKYIGDHSWVGTSITIIDSD